MPDESVCTLTLALSGEQLAALRVLPSLVRHGVIPWDDFDAIMDDIIDMGFVEVTNEECDR